MTVSARLKFRAAMRKASVDLLNAYAQSASLSLQVYPALPTTFRPPTAFVERIDGVASYPGMTLRDQSARVQIVVLFRVFAEGERLDAANQSDEFVDGFLDYVTENYHQPGPTELIAGTRINDEPEYVISGSRGAVTYFAVRIQLEGQTAN